MVSDEMMKTVMSLSAEDKRQILAALLNDPELEINPFDPLGLRQNHEAARILQDMLEEYKASHQPEIK